MIRILLSGHGQMGRCLEELILGEEDLALAGILAPDSPAPMDGAEVAIDFSSPQNLPSLLSYVEKNRCALVCGTTGYSPQDLELLRRTGERVPVVSSANFSVGIAVLRQILGQTAALLGEGFDVEIVEAHHRQKADAPSGTAKLLLEAADPHHRCIPVYSREGVRSKRGPREIGVHSIRGGTVAGEHTVFFFGEDEVLELTHKAASRRIFAAGALRAARAIVHRAAGFYSLEELLFSEEGEST